MSQKYNLYYFCTTDVGVLFGGTLGCYTEFGWKIFILEKDILAKGLELALW